MNFVLRKDHSLISDGKVLGVDEENKSETIDITVEDESLFDKWPYIEFVLPKGTEFLTPRLDIVNGQIHYVVPNCLMVAGYLKIQIVFRDFNNWIWKSFIVQVTVRTSLNVVDHIAEENPDFINEAQKILDYFNDQAALIDTKVDKTTKINGYTLDRDVDLISEDVGAYSKEEIEDKYISGNEIDALFL